MAVPADRQSSDRTPAVLNLTDAIRQVVRSYEWATNNRRTSPFFFLIGAGVSVPQVPLARDIIRHCKKLCGVTDEQAGGNLLEEYSYWLDQAYNAPELRQDYFRRLIEGRPIPAAQFRLAHLLLSEGMRQPFTNLVVTTNFDNFLTRALSLFGREYVLCDSPMTAPRLVLSNPDVLQIVHVHGSHQFYDIRNLSEEISETAAASEDTSATMSSLLESLLRDRSPIVVGYGGWDGDVFMKALRRRLRGGTLPHPMYWCCYEHGSWRSLPTWLRANLNVRFIEPDPAPISNITASVESDAATAAVLSEADLSDRNVLSGQAVFDGLIQGLSLPEPALTRNPVAFFADHLNHSLPTEEADSSRDPYRIRSTIDEMRAAAEWVHQYRQQRSAVQQQLQGLREHLRAAKYVDAIAPALGIAVDDLSDGERRDLLEMALEIVESSAFSDALTEETLSMLRRIQEIGAGVALVPAMVRRVAVTRKLIIKNLAVLERWDEAGRELREFIDYAKGTADSDIVVAAATLINSIGAAYMTSAPDEAARAFELNAADFGHLSDEKLQPLLASALGARASIAFTQSDTVHALELTDQFLSRYSSLPDTLVQHLVANLLSWKAESLQEGGRSDEALGLYDEILARFDDPADPVKRGRLSRVLLNKGSLLGKLGRHREAIRAYDDLLQRFKDVIDLNIRENVLNALVRKGAALRKLDQLHEALAVFDEVLRRYGDAQEVTLRKSVAWALMGKAFTLAQLQREEEALSACDDIVSRLGDATEADLRYEAAAALDMRAGFLEKLGRRSAAIALYEDVDRRFNEAVEPSIRGVVARALYHRAALLEEVHGDAAGVAAYAQFVQRFGHAAEADIREYVATVLNNWAFVLVRRAKAQWDTPGGETVATLNEAGNKIERALNVTPRDPIMLGNKGYILFLQGRADEAAIALRATIELGGTEIRDRLQAVTEINPIPLDEAFQALVRGIEIT